MTDEQINIKIAELCGYRKATERDRTRGKYEWVAINPDGFEVGWSDNCEYHHCIPNYAADLNACHEFEKTLTHINDWMLYDKALAEIAEGFTFHATARQRCEAFLRVHGQWEEEA